MNKSEAKTAIKALYLQSAAMAGFEVSPFSPEELVKLVQEGFPNVEERRRGEAVANALRLIAMTLELAEKTGATLLQEKDVIKAKEKLCPIYPFGGQGHGLSGKRLRRSR